MSSGKAFPHRAKLTNRDLRFTEMTIWKKSEEYLSLEEHSELIAEKDKEIARLRAALEFYAKDENWNILDRHEGTTFSWVNKLDPRILAEQALAGGE